MHKKLLLLPLLLWAVTALGQSEALTTLRIELLYGGEMEHVLATIGKITFNVEAKEMCLSNKKGVEMGCTSLHMIGKIVFTSDGAPTDLAAAESGTIQIFPNPTQDMLCVHGIEGEQMVRIFDMQGRLMQSASALEGEAQLQVGSLPAGTYLLQLGAQVVRFIKE